MNSLHMMIDYAFEHMQITKIRLFVMSCLIESYFVQRNDRTSVLQIDDSCHDFSMCYLKDVEKRDVRSLR